MDASSEPDLLGRTRLLGAEIDRSLALGRVRGANNTLGPVRNRPLRGRRRQGALRQLLQGRGPLLRDSG